MVKAQVSSGASIGLLLGLLMGLSASPVVALVVGALAALLGSLVLPTGLAAKAGEADAAASPARQRAAGWRSAAFGMACTAGLFAGLWLRTHDALSPPRPTLAQQVAELQSAGFPADEARRLVAARHFPASGAGEARVGAAPDHRASVLFGADSSACERLAPSRYASVDAAAQAYEAAGEKSLAAMARAMAAAVPDEHQRMAALTAAVQTLCAAR